MEDLERDPARDGVAGLREQRDTIRRELQAKIQPTLAQIAQVWENYEVAQNALATPEQKQAHPAAASWPAADFADGYQHDQRDRALF